METDRPAPRSNWTRWRWPVLIGVVALATVGLLALLANIMERQQEGRDPFYRVVEITDTTQNPAVWGENFPLHFDLYSRTVDMQRTRYGGSEAIPRTPTDADPRDTVAFSRLAHDPRLVELWAGYPFAEDFREERGHAYMLSDQVYTRRQLVRQQPGTCLHCHASVYVPYLRAGDGDLMAGFERVNQMTFQEAVQLVDHPVACIDCHDPQTMRLRVTRPGFIEGIRTVKAAQGVADYDVNRDATRMEMRTYVCGQCHVEYYFQGPERRLTYPWARGLTADSMLAYYEEVGFSDWTHAVTGGGVLKAQHPEFELHSQGVHARSGVSCADCHMPYTRQGAMKVSDHWVRSPLLNVANACQTCHPWSENELTQRVHTIQDRTYQLRNIAIDATLELARAIAAAAREDEADARLTEARRRHRRALFLTDFIEAENSMGFHADQEAARILGLAINEARLGMIALLNWPALTAAVRQPIRPEPMPETVAPQPSGGGPGRPGATVGPRR